MIPAALGAPGLPRRVRAEWADYNGHLNMAYYHVLFDEGIGDVFHPLGLGTEGIAAHGGSIFVAETHTRYLAELFVGEEVVVCTRFLDLDARAVHYLQTMLRGPGEAGGEGAPVATNEGLILHVDLAARRVAPFAAPVLARLERMREAHARHPAPEGVGARIAIRRRPQPR